MLDKLLGNEINTRFTFGSNLWVSIKNRKEADVSCNEAVDYILLKFACDDFHNKTNVRITREMVEEERKRFIKILEEVKTCK